MKELTIVSGKGGTGKTTVCAAFASLAGNKVLTDCDVDAANLHLLLEPKVLHDKVFIGGRTPNLDPALCIKSGDCQEVCRFDAIEKESNGDYIIDALACENCGLCAHVCPVEAIHMVDAINGRWFISRTPVGTLVHARLDPGEDNSGKLVTRKSVLDFDCGSVSATVTRMWDNTWERLDLR